MCVGQQAPRPMCNNLLPKTLFRKLRFNYNKGLVSGLVSDTFPLSLTRNRLYYSL